MRPAAGALAIGLLFAGAWLAVHPPLPQLPTGDVFTSLSVARHLSRGDGLVNDTIYPLLTAYPWGRDFPQPLVHRTPGLAVLLLPAWWLSGGDPGRAEDLVRPVMLAVLVLLIVVGAWTLQRHGATAAASAWALMLLLNPLLALAVRWGWSEVAAGFFLLAAWLLLRRRAPAAMSPGRAAGFAALAALLAYVRFDLLWVPVVWWCATAMSQRRRQVSRLLPRTALAALVGAGLLAPWWQHVARHTGSPLTNPLADAVQLDLSAEWWQYPLLRSRTPLPLAQNLTENPGPALRKIRSGVRHYAVTLGQWLPWLVWIGGLVLWAAQTRRRWRRGHRRLAATGPPGLLAATLGFMVLQYAFFSQETRHLLPLLPLVAWETALLADRRLRPRLPRPAVRGIALAALAAVAIVLVPAGLGGEADNVAAARASAARVAAVTLRAARELPPGPVFSDTAIIPWRLNRAFVWSPFDAAIEAEVRLLVPALREAPYIRLHEQPPAASGDDLRGSTQ